MISIINISRNNKDNPKNPKNPKNSNAKAIALISIDSYVYISTSVINTAEYLAQKGYQVDLFIVESDKFAKPEFNNSNIKTIYMKNRYSKRFLLKDIEIVIKYFSPPHRYQFVIGYDPGGLIRAGLLSLIWKVPYLFHSLEISIHNKSWKQLILKKIEDWFARKALLTLTQDETRANLIAHENSLNQNKIAVVYNSPLGDILPIKDNYFRNKFNIPSDKIIVVAVGSLIKEHLIHHIVESIDNWPEGFVLVVHGWFADGATEQIVNSKKNANPQKVYISTELIDHSTKHRIFQSADVGLVFFDPINLNLKYSAGAAGKLFDFLRAGVPIIGNNIPGMAHLVESSHCGVVVNNTNDIGIALPKIIDSYEYYREHCFASYKKYEFGSCFSQVLENIEARINKVCE